MKLIKNLLFYVLVLVIAVIAIFPFYYAIVTSFKSGTALFEVDYWPKVISLANYISVLTTGNFPRNFLNSVIVSTAVVAISLLLAITAAFALARVRFRGRSLLLLTILSVSMFPQIAVLSGMFELINRLGLYNNLLALTLSYMIFTLPFTVWVLTSFFRGLPEEIEQAAIVDGATPFQRFRMILLPLLAPALVTTGLLSFVSSWNEYLFALNFTITNPAAQTVTVAIAQFSGVEAMQEPIAEIMAAAMIVTIPLVALVLIFQNRIAEGLTAGAVKG